VVELYDAGIRRVDAQVARLIDYLKQHRLWENCAFALTADHGEEFLEHERRYHAPVSLSEEITRVPLMIRVSTSGKKRVPETPFSHLHLAPTLLEIVDVPAPPSFKGRSLWRNLQQELPWGGPAVAECAYGCTNPFRAEAPLAPRLVSVRDARHKLVLRIEPGAVEELYDLKAEGAEKRSLPAAAENEVRIRFLQAVRKHVTETAMGTDMVARLKARLRDVRVEWEQIHSRVS
jgi:arylsulfatase A-like enzyme